MITLLITCLYNEAHFILEDGGSTFPQNVSIYQQNYMVSQPRKPQSQDILLQVTFGITLNIKSIRNRNTMKPKVAAYVI
jgi:hypothetical protein